MISNLWKYIYSKIRVMKYIRYAAYINYKYKPNKNRRIDDLDEVWERNNNRFNKIDTSLLFLNLRKLRKF